MWNLKKLLVTLIAAPVGSCMTTFKSTEPALPLGHNFSYSLSDRENVNLIQAFDDGSTTYLQFKEAPPAAVDIRQERDDQPLVVTLDQRYAKVPGVYPTLRISVAGHLATLINQAAPAASNVSAARTPPADLTTPIDQPRSETMSAVIAPDSLALQQARLSSSESLGIEARRSQTVAVGVPEHLQTMHANLRVAALKHEISTLEDNVRILSAELEEAQRAGREMGLYMRNVGASPAWWLSLVTTVLRCKSTITCSIP